MQYLEATDSNGTDVYLFQLEDNLFISIPKNNWSLNPYHYKRLKGFGEMSDRLLKESDVLKIAFQLPLVVNSAFADAVKVLPSADRPQGEWKEMYRNGFGNIICMCSKCNFHASRSRYCPNCGARMKGADDE